MRLIDADELIKSIEQSRNNNPHKDCHVKRNHDIEHNHFIKMVYDQPTAFDKEKVSKELKKCRVYQFQGMLPDGRICHFSDMINIVEKGGIE